MDIHYPDNSRSSFNFGENIPDKDETRKEVRKDPIVADFLDAVEKQYQRMQENKSKRINKSGNALTFGRERMTDESAKDEKLVGVLASAVLEILNYSRPVHTIRIYCTARIFNALVQQTKNPPSKIKANTPPKVNLVRINVINEITLETVSHLVYDQSHHTIGIRLQKNRQQWQITNLIKISPPRSIS